MDDDPSAFADMPSFTSLHGTTELEIRVAPTDTNEKNLVRLALIPIACWRCNEQNFAFDSSFVDPGFTLGKLPQLIHAFPESLASLFGHADPVGDDGYNHILSGRRAKAMYGLLTRQESIWNDLYDHHVGGDAWGDRSTQAILHSLDNPDSPDGNKYYEGPVDGRARPAYTNALHAFQDHHGVPRAATATKATRDALYPRYMKLLCGDFRMSPDKFLGRAKGEEKNGRGDYQGCSEFNPVILLPAKEEYGASKERDVDNAPNRRVVMLFFRDDVDLKMTDWPCPAAGSGAGKCYGQFWPGGLGDKRRAIQKDKKEYAKNDRTMACRFYDRFARRSPCEGRPVVIHSPNTIAITIDAPQIAPLVEDLDIRYAIGGPVERVWALRLYVVAKSAPDKVLFEKLIDGPYAATGSVLWNGEVSDGAFDGCVNVKSSPYLVRIELETKGGARKTKSNECEVKVEVHSVDLHVDNVLYAVTPNVHKPAIEALKKELSSGGGTGRLILDTPVFPGSNSPDLQGGAYADHKTYWGEGIEVPILARVFLNAKDGSKKRSARALHASSLLWELWLDSDGMYSAALLERGVTPKAKLFVEKVSAYKKDDTKPKGRTAHEHLGGRRTDDSSYFGHLFSGWQWSRAKHRPFGSVTKCQNAAGVDADTGLKLKPGFTAGDRFHVRAYFDIGGTLDAKDDKILDAVPASRRAGALHISVWKRIFVHRILKYGSSANIDFDALARQFKKAAVLIEKGPAFIETDITARYKAAYKRAVHAYIAQGSPFVTHAAHDDPEEYPARFRGWSDYWERTHPNASLLEKLLHRLGAIIVGDDEKAYQDNCDDYATKLVVEASRDFAPFPQHGVTIFVWSKGCLQNNDSHIGGFAGVLPPLYGGSNAAFFTFSTNDNVVAHEMGHTLYLAHQSGASDKDHPPSGVDDHAHDVNATCLMSYVEGAAHLCGLCLMKLAAWDTRGSAPGKTKIDGDGTVT